MTHAEKVLALLSDGQPHGHMEGYRLGVMLHSRVADLRKKGYQIDCWREGDEYLYQLRGSLEGADSAASIPSSERDRALGASSSECDGGGARSHSEQLSFWTKPVAA